MRLVRIAVAVAGAAATASAIGALGAHRLLSEQARIARKAIGKPLGEQAFHLDKTYKRKRGSTITLVMFGDSIAAGLGAERPRHTLGVQLAKGLAKASHRAVRLVSMAEVGAESAQLTDQIAALHRDVAPDVAVIVVGGNDVTHRVRISDSVAHLEDGVRLLRDRGVQVVVGTCPDLGALVLVPQPLRGLARQASRRLAQAQRDSATRSGGYAVSLSEIVGPVFISEPNEMFALDRFHPSGAGYRRTAKAMLPSVLASLGLEATVPFGHHEPADRVSAPPTPDARASTQGW